MENIRNRRRVRIAGLLAAAMTGICPMGTGAAPLSQEVMEVMPERMLERYTREEFPSDVMFTGMAQSFCETQTGPGTEIAGHTGENAAAGETETKDKDKLDAGSNGSGAGQSQSAKAVNAVAISDSILDKVIFKIADPVPMHPESLVNIRSGPGTDYEVIGTVVGTDRVMARNLINGWYMVDFRGLHGYISASLLYTWADESG